MSIQATLAAEAGGNQRTIVSKRKAEFRTKVILNKK
jgi:hypothetical protein